MTDNELYLKKKQAELDIWSADLAKLRAKSSKASAEIQMEMHKVTKSLASKIDESKKLLSTLSKATGEAWGSVKSNVETTWNSLKCSFDDANKKCTSNSTRVSNPANTTKITAKTKF